MNYEIGLIYKYDDELVDIGMGSVFLIACIDLLWIWYPGVKNCSFRNQLIQEINELRWAYWTYLETGQENQSPLYFQFFIWGLLKFVCLQQLVKLEKERRKEECDFSQLDWLKLVAVKQTISTTTEIDFIILSASERNAAFSSFTNPIFSAFLEWLFREQEHLKRENGNEMEKYLLLVNRQCIQMNDFYNKCCFQWDWECLFKSNQIKSYFPISHIPYNCEYPNYFPEFEWVKEDLNNHHHNTIHISFHFNLLFMINVLS